MGGALLFWLMYLGGGFSGGAFEFGGITQFANGTESYLATNVLQPNVTWPFALLTECLLTFLFVFVVLGATSKWGNSGLAGVAIGLALGLVNIVGIPVDNCSVNPARSFGPAIFSTNAWPDFWIMVVGPFVGAVCAAIAYRWLASAPRKVERID